jgi:hypothetical protein
MDRGLMARALIIGFVWFIIAIAGFYYLSITAAQSDRQYQEIIGEVPPANSNEIGAVGLFILSILGLVVLMMIAGAVTTLTSSQYRDRPGDFFRASALAGGTPVMLFWIIFWCLTLANIVGIFFDHMPFGSGDLVFLALALGVNVLTVGIGALIAGLSGLATRMLVRGIAGRHAD